MGVLFTLIRYSQETRNFLIRNLKMKNTTLKLGLTLMMMAAAPLCANEYSIGEHTGSEKDANQWNTYKEGIHTSYIGHEFVHAGGHTPAIGYRYQKDKLILDTCVGYKYINLGPYSFHYGTASMNIFYSLHQSPRSQTYGGIGITGEVISNKFLGERSKEYSASPSITVGRDLMFSKTKKIFCEVIYKPYSYGKNYKGKSHLTSFRIGIGF